MPNEKWISQVKWISWISCSEKGSSKNSPDFTAMAPKLHHPLCKHSNRGNHPTSAHKPSSEGCTKQSTQDPSWGRQNFHRHNFTITPGKCSKNPKLLGAWSTSWCTPRRSSLPLPALGGEQSHHLWQSGLCFLHRNILHLQQYFQQPHSAPTKINVGFAAALCDCCVQLALLILHWFPPARNML